MPIRSKKHRHALDIGEKSKKRRSLKVSSSELPKDANPTILAGSIPVNSANRFILGTHPHSSIPLSSENNTHIPSSASYYVKKCENCLRCDVDPYGVVIHGVKIQHRPRGHLSFKKKLCSMKEGVLCEADVMICDECYNTLLDIDEKRATYRWSDCWPSFIWQMLANPLNSGRVMDMWQYLPFTMRSCWLDSFRVLGQNYAGVSLFEPRSLFDDITSFSDEIERLTSTGSLVDLMKGCNSNHYCSVRCPWGCTEFPDECGYVSYAKLLYAKGFQMPLSESSIIRWVSGQSVKSKCFVGIRDDYLSPPTYFMNFVDRPIRPCIRFVSGKGPMICTCKEHDGGSSKQYLHPPVNPVTGSTPCTSGDQLAHAVVAPRMIKAMKKNKYSDSYQMQRCCGGFRGTDSCNLMDPCRFDRNTCLSDANTTLSLYGRPDIRSKLSQMVGEQVIPSCYEADFLELTDSMDYPSQSDHLALCRAGSNFVPLANAMKMMMHAEKCCKLAFAPSWPLSLFSCQPSISNYGKQPSQVAPFRVKQDLRLPWFLLSMASNIPILWECIVDSVPHNGSVSWHGWLLSFATKNVLEGISCRRSRSTSKNPYKGNLTPLQLAWKLQSRLDEEPTPPKGFSPVFTLGRLQHCLEEIQKVACFSSLQAFSRARENCTIAFSTEVIVRTSCSEDGDTLPPGFILHFGDQGNVHFELVYVGRSKAGIDPGKWTADILCKQVDKDLPHFWAMSRGGNSVPVEVKTFEQVDIAVWVRRSLPNGDSFRSDYLKYMGGNVDSKCPIHHFPLVTCPLGSGNKCVSLLKSDTRCGKAAAFECPFCSCTTYLCKSCIGITLPPIAKEPSSRINTDDVSVASVDPTDTSYHSITDSSLNTSTDTDSTILCEEKKDGGRCISAMSVDNDKSMLLAEEASHFSADTYPSDSDECSQVSSASLPEILLPDVAYDADRYNAELFAGLSDDSDDDSVISVSNPKTWPCIEVPTTNASMAAPKVTVRDRKSRFPMHVLMNEHGTLLLRNNKQLRPTRGVKGFLQRIVATATGQSIPLLYPEAMLFPSIFWNQQDDGSYDGAIPIGLWNGNQTANEFGYATLPEHMRCRVKNSSLLCSTDPRYIYFAFDSVNNIMSRGIDNRLVLRRGFEHMLGPTKILGQSNDSMLSSDMLDSRRNVMKLAAMVREKEPTFFYTHTCNQSEHFGIAPLRGLLNFRLELLELRRDEYTGADFEELRTSYHHIVSTQIIRTWFKVGKMFMNYILTSHEKPLGTIERHWWRWEYQDANGNLPHIHCLLWTKENKHNTEDLRILQEKICCSVGSFFASPQEAECYAAEGLLPDADTDTISDMVDMVKRIQTHSCAAGNYRCMRRVGAGDADLQCRVVDYFKENPYPAFYGYKKINPRHRDEAVELFKSLGLYNEAGEPVDRRFAAGRYVYPACPQEHFSPCNARLFLAHRSSDNLVLTDTYFSCRYLAKYIQGVDENCRVDIKAGKEKDEIVLEPQKVANTKIATGNIMENKRKQTKRHNPNFSGRALGLSEAVGLLLQEPQVFTNASFVSIPTVPLEQRPAHEKVSRTQWCTDIREEAERQTKQQQIPIGRGKENFIGRHVRCSLNLPAHRQFSDMEEIIIRDALGSPLSFDGITLFACRPPELRFINQPSMYLVCFTRLKHCNPNRLTGKSTTEELLKTNLFDCGWVDGLDCQVLVKPKAIPFLLEQGIFDGETRDLFQCLNYIVYGTVVNGNRYVNIASTELENIQHRFVDVRFGYETMLPLPLYGVVRPTQGSRFLIFLLLSLGRYNNEGELFSGSSMNDFFVNAQLLPDQQSVTEADIRLLTKRFILEQLLFVPGGTMAFDRMAVAAYNLIRSALLENCVGSTEVPSYLYTSLVSEATQTALSFHNTMRKSLATVLSENLPNVPGWKELDGASKASHAVWVPKLERIPGQLEESYKECCKVFQRTCSAIDVYTRADSNRPARPLIICGGPGMGKTFQLQMAAAYGMSKGLSVAITAAMSERAITLGGRHIHYLFCLPGDNTNNVHRIIDKSLRGLSTNPDRLQFLRTLDILCLDEMGYLSAEILNVMDTVLRSIRCKSSFMGGVLLFATLDHKQLPPIRARPALLSTLVITNFEMIKMEHSIRARTDSKLQTLISIPRMDLVDSNTMNTFREIIINSCKHVKTWDDNMVTTDMVRVLGTRKGVIEAESEYLKKVKKEGLLLVSREAETVQSVSSSHGNWKRAEKQIVEKMNRVVNEVQVLHLHKNMVVECTYNKDGCWSNSQMGVLLDLPGQIHLDMWKPICIMLAPVGTRMLPNVPLTKFNLQEQGWKEVNIGTAPEMEHSLSRGIMAKRKQYGIRPRIAMTIHRAMGGDFGKVVTCVGGSSDGHKLWLKEQVIVLISRTHTASDLMFVGKSPEHTAQTLVDLLFKVTPFSAYMLHVVGQMCNQNLESIPVIRPLQHLPYNVRDTIIPTNTNAFVYLLMSLKDFSSTYIGQTKNLARRIEQHNSGLGAASTANRALRPWHCIAFVTGFDETDAGDRRKFESMWQNRRNKGGHYVMDPWDVMEVGKYLVGQCNTACGSNQLRFTQCMEFLQQPIENQIGSTTSLLSVGSLLATVEALPSCHANNGVRDGADTCSTSTAVRKKGYVRKKRDTSSSELEVLKEVSLLKDKSKSSRIVFAEDPKLKSTDGNRTEYVCSQEVPQNNGTIQLDLFAEVKVVKRCQKTWNQLGKSSAERIRSKAEVVSTFSSGHMQWNEIREAMVGDQSFIFFKLNSYTIRRQSLQNLLPQQWLSDDIIDFYGAILNSRQNVRTQTTGEGVLILSVFFLTLLVPSPGVVNYNAVRRWIPAWTQRGLFHLKKLLLPLNREGSHWALLEINFQEQTFAYYDSLGYESSTWIEACKQLLRYEHTIGHFAQPNTPMPDFDAWQVVDTSDCIVQRNSYDCGIFVIAFMDHLWNNQRVSVSQNEMISWRYRIWEMFQSYRTT